MISRSRPSTAAANEVTGKRGGNARRVPGDVLPDGRRGNFRREVLGADAGRPAEGHQPLNLVSAGERSRATSTREQLERFRRKRKTSGLAEPFGRISRRNKLVRWGISSRRSRSGGIVNADDGEPVVQILAEFAFGDPLFQVGIGRGNHADVDPLRPRLADRHDLALLEKPKQLRLDVERQVADFVEEQRAAGRRSHQAQLIVDRAREAAPSVAEQLAVGELAAWSWCSCRAGTPRRCAAIRRGSARATSSLPVPLSPVMSTVRSFPCSRWICSTTRIIAGLAHRNPGSSGSSGCSWPLRPGPPAAGARRRGRIPAPRWRRSCARPASARSATGRGERMAANAVRRCRVPSAADHPAGAVRAPSGA